VKLHVFGMTMLLLAGPAAALAGDLNESYQDLQQAVAKKDVAAVKKLVAEMHPMINEALAVPAPQAADEKQTWSSQIDWAKSVQVYTEYALYATALTSPPPVLVELIATLEQDNPKSKYLDQAYSAYFYGLNQTGASAKILPIAEKALVNFPENEDLLLYLTDNAVTRKNSDRVLAYANRLVASLSRHPKPEGVSQGDWDRKKNVGLARGYWVAGVVSGEKNQYAAADRNLRAALPLISGDALTGPAYFYLGVANYNIGKMTANKSKLLEAAKFSDQAAAIAGPFQDQAWKNAALIKKEAATMR
jgi:tetratricopeptide (TPR) repeat protein